MNYNEDSTKDQLLNIFKHSNEEIAEFCFNNSIIINPDPLFDIF